MADGGSPVDRWWIGCTAAAVGSLGAGLGENLVRLSFASLPPDEADHPPMYKRPLWVCGWLLTTILTSACAIVGLMFAPLQLVMPIGGLHILFGVWVAHVMNGEGLGKHDLAGAAAVLVGVMVVLLGVEKHSPRVTFENLYDVIFAPSSMLFFSCTTAMVVGLAMCQRFPDKSLNRYVAAVVTAVRPVSAPALSGLMSANANLMLKFAISLRAEGGGWTSAPNHLPFYVFCILALSCGVAQVVTLNHALELSAAVLVVPTSNSVLITVGSTAGLVYAPNVTYMNSLALFVGVVLVIGGIVLLAMREQHYPTGPSATQFDPETTERVNSTANLHPMSLEPNPSFTSVVSTTTRGSFGGYCENISFNQIDHVQEIRRTLSRFGRITKSVVENDQLEKDKAMVLSPADYQVTPPTDALGQSGCRPRVFSRINTLNVSTPTHGRPAE